MEERQDLISRQVAIDLVKDVCDAIMSGCESWYDPETEDEVYKDIREVDAILKCNKEIRIALRNMPPAQPEIIRCKYCTHSKHWYKDKRRCFLWHEEGIDVFEDGYCNYAKRRMRGEQDE